MSTRVFLSYRRADTAAEANRLRGSLERRLGRGSVFMDVEAIHAGERWRDRLDAAVKGCDVMTVLIGPDWTGADAEGMARLMDPEDVVRAEVVSGLRFASLVIPVLVRGAAMPSAHELPDDLRDLPSLQAATIDEGMWTYDAEQLVRTVADALVQQEAPEQAKRPGVEDLVGRDVLLERLDASLAAERLVTLTGAGGCGKTSMALAGAARAASADGSTFVDLTPVRGDALPSAIAQALGIRELPVGQELEAIALRLSGATALVLLDNCEHVVEPAANLVADLLVRCPDLTILATSREPLGIEAEVTISVPPLALPEGDHPGEVEDAPSVQLFARRARRADPSFELTAETIGDVAAVCRRVAGIPLAIELAAAQMRTMDAATIAERLGSRIDLLAGRRGGDPRHRTMVDMLDWSYGLLEPGDARVFDRLSVFEGGFDLEAAAAVCGEDVDAVSAVASLTTRSLVVGERGSSGFRYRMLEPVRQYAADHLEGKALEDISDRHLAHFTELVERAEPGVRGPDQLRWHRRLRADFPNIRAARIHAIANEDAESQGRIVSSLWWAWRGSIEEAFSWAEEAMTSEEAMTPATRASLLYCATFWTNFLSGSVERFSALQDRALDALGEVKDRMRLAETASRIRQRDGDYALAQQLLRDAVAESRSPTDVWRRAFLIEGLGAYSLQAGDTVASVGYFREAIEIYRVVGDVHERLSASGNMSDTLIRAGDIEGARMLATAAIELVDDELSPDDHASLLWVLGDIAVHDGDHAGGAERYRQAFDLLWKSGFTGLISEVITRLAELQIARGRPVSSIELSAVAAALVLQPAVLTQSDRPPQIEVPGSVSTSAADAAWTRGSLIPRERIPSVIEDVVEDIRAGNDRSSTG